MNRLKRVTDNFQRRKNRVRSTITGTTGRPRLSVSISNRHVTAQIIDDVKHSTVAHVTTVGQKNIGQTMTEKAAWAGQEIGKKAKTAKVTSVVFDRGGRLYHGRVKALAEAARQTGLEF